MANLWKRCLVVKEGSMEPTLSAIAWPREWMVWMASSVRPPSVSATMGMHSILETGWLEASLHCTPFWVKLLRRSVAGHMDIEGSGVTAAQRNTSAE